MKLTKSEIETLNKWGYPDKDILQIEQAIKICKYWDENDKRVSRKKTIEMLGREEWLSGIARAAFHWDSVRGEEGNTILFDCSKLFK